MGGWLWVSCKSYCTLYKSLRILSISVSCKVASWNWFQGSDFTFKVLWLSYKTETLCLISNLPTPPSATPSDPNFVSSSLTPLYNTYAWNCMTLLYYHGLISSWIRISSLKSLGDYIFINYIFYKKTRCIYFIAYRPRCLSSYPAMVTCNAHLFWFLWTTYHELGWTDNS